MVSLITLQRKLSARSDRVKCVDLHPSEAWMLVSLYNGNLHVWNYDSQVSFPFVKPEHLLNKTHAYFITFYDVIELPCIVQK